MVIEHHAETDGTRSWGPAVKRCSSHIPSWHENEMHALKYPLRPLQSKFDESHLFRAHSRLSKDCRACEDLILAFRLDKRQ